MTDKPHPFALSLSKGSYRTSLSKGTSTMFDDEVLSIVADQPHPFVLSLSKGLHGRGFDKLSPNGAYLESRQHQP